MEVEVIEKFLETKKIYSFKILGKAGICNNKYTVSKIW